MSKQAYDEKNSVDYDENTKRLNEALDEISNNPNLPATQIKVAEISGISRNTVSNREFPATRLKEIKEKRKRDKEKKKVETRSQKDELIEERDNIAKEAVHWFFEFTIAKRDRDDFERQLSRQRDSAEFYKKEFEKLKKKVQSLEFQNEQLADLLRDIKKE